MSTGIFFLWNCYRLQTFSHFIHEIIIYQFRAYPYAKLDQEGLDQHKETLFKVVHITTNFNVTLQAFMLLYQVQGESEAQDRFYSGKTKSTIYHLSSEKRGVCLMKMT